MNVDSVGSLAVGRNTSPPLASEGLGSHCERLRDRLGTLPILVIAGVLFISALPKLAAVHQLYLTLSLSPFVAFQQFSLLFVVTLCVWELTIGGLRVALPRHRSTAGLMAITFATYAVYLSIQSLRGVTSCPCLGGMDIRWMLAIDAGILLALFAMWKTDWFVMSPSVRVVRRAFLAVLIIV